MASILINGSPTSEFQFHCGLKQRDPLAPCLFILIMESLHLSFSRAVDAEIFTGIEIDSSLTISYLFYADDAVFIGEWSNDNLTGVGTSNDTITAADLNLGCSVIENPFKYLGVMVGGNSSMIKAWDDTIGKLKARLSNWKLKTLSIGGRLTLLKSVLGSTPIYNMSLYKVPKSVLHLMESIRWNFFNGVQSDERKITWVKWSKVLALKNRGLGVSSYYAFNRALLFKWVWRFISQGNSLWCRFITSMHGSQLLKLSPFHSSTWNTIIWKINVLKSQGVDLISHCKIHVGNGMRTQFWNDTWVGDTHLRYMFPCIYALEVNKVCTVADKLQDRWVWDLNGKGVFRVKDLRNLLDESFFPKDSTAMRWIKSIPIKINIFAWKVYLDRLPTRLNLIRRGVQVPSLSCPVCNSAYEDMSHLLFSCDLANDVVRLIFCWWNLTWSPLGLYWEWLPWNQLLFANQNPRKDVIFDDIVSRSFTGCRARLCSAWGIVSFTTSEEIFTDIVFGVFDPLQKPRSMSQLSRFPGVELPDDDPRGRGVKQKGGSNARKTTMTSGKDVEGVSSMISSDQPLVGQPYGSPSPFTLEEILCDIKRQIYEGKLVLVGDDGKPLKPSRLTRDDPSSQEAVVDQRLVPCSRMKIGFLSSRGRGVKQKGGSNVRKTTMTSGKDVEGVSSMISSDQPLVGQFTSFSDAYGSPSPFT
nr:RNA-directed DNA polymerase, eukaryota, reverse transcriptase zinc-binding domain protein [Tanacetum cinerariifolium]